MRTVEETADRLATLLIGGSSRLYDPTGSDLEFETDLIFAPLPRHRPPSDIWAVDGGQGLVADARTLQLWVTRAARVRWQADNCTLQEEGDILPHLLGCGEERRTLASVGGPMRPDAAVDVNLLRDWGEWDLAARCVEEADPGGLVLIDGDLVPDWRIPAAWLSALLQRAADRGVTLAGVTKHSSLARGGAPLVGELERDADLRYGPRGMWWVPVARTRPEIGPGLRIVVARLDPDARFAFRIDLPADADSEEVLSALAGVCDDAAFPGYPYPLTVADGLAACPRWLREDIWDQVQGCFDRMGVPDDVRDRAFTDRHRLMERS